LLRIVIFLDISASRQLDEWNEWPAKQFDDPINPTAVVDNTNLALLGTNRVGNHF
jgi:hypothetical protein